MALACDKCGTSDFSVKDRESTMSLVCSECRRVMCWACAGRVLVNGITALCCYNCGSMSLRDAEIWADRLIPTQDKRE